VQRKAHAADVCCFYLVLNLVFNVVLLFFHSMYKIIKLQIMTGFGWSLIKKELDGSESAGTFITC